MSDTVLIPDTLEAAVEQLDGLGNLITARKWQRAAIVAAFVRLPGSGAHNRLNDSSDFQTAAQFAERGIVGLASHVSVTKYVQAWLDAHEGEYPEPGSTQELPEDTFPPMRTGTNGHSSAEGAQRTIDRIVQTDPLAITRAFDTMPSEQREMIEQEIAKRSDFIAAVKANPVLRDELVEGLLGTEAERKARAEERARQLINRHPLFGWSQVADGLGTATYGTNSALDALVKLAINARVDSADDALQVARLRAEKLGRSIHELEMAWGETPISDKIEELRRDRVS